MFVIILIMNKKYKWVFLGTPKISVYFLEKLKTFNLLPNLIVTNPDSLMGRKKILTPSPVAIWAEKNNIKVLKPKNMDEKSQTQNLSFLFKENYDFFFVLAYGKILKKEILDIPKFGTINLHPSLLPKYRGPSPIISSILDDQKKTGLSLMLLDEKMDQGPILLQKKIEIIEWRKNNILEKKFAELGAELFYQNYYNIIDNKIIAKKQNNLEATYCQKYKKKDMELNFPLNQRLNFLKYCAFSKPFFFDENKKRNIVTLAEWKNNEFIIKKIIPEGKKERNF